MLQCPDMVESQIIYRGQLHCDARHSPSGTVVSTDAPVDNHGLGQAFSPTDLVAAALGSCVLTIMGIMANRGSFSIDGATCRVEKHMTTSGPRKIARLLLELHLPAAITDDNRQKLSAAAHACPVHNSLHPDIVIDIQYHWDQ